MRIMAVSPVGAALLDENGKLFGKRAASADRLDSDMLRSNMAAGRRQRELDSTRRPDPTGTVPSTPMSVKFHRLDSDMLPPWQCQQFDHVRGMPI